MATITVKYLKTDNGEEIKVYKASKVDIDAVYPVGSVYISVSSVSPASIFGGSWEQLEGKFLLGEAHSSNVGLASYGYAWSGNNYWYYFDKDGNRVGISVGKPSYSSTGGETSHQLKATEMPSHSHTVSPNGSNTLAGGGPINPDGPSWCFSDVPDGSAGNGASGKFYAWSTGGDGAHNNMPPYQIVYMWRRLS